MAVDGPGIFENDDACDWLSVLDEEPTSETLREALQLATGAPPDEYLEVDDGAAAIAAAEVLARALDSRLTAAKPLRARTLAALRKNLSADPAARRAWLIEIARTAVVRISKDGNTSELAAMFEEMDARADRAWKRELKTIDARLAKSFKAVTADLAKIRPDTVPRDAVFDSKSCEWKVESRDDRRRRHGVASHFRPDGTLVETVTYEHGIEAGPFTRFHESGEVSRRGMHVGGKLEGTVEGFRSKRPTSERLFEDVAPNIVRIELDYRAGFLTTMRWFDAQGRALTGLGDPLPKRPSTVPKNACFNADSQWVQGDADEESRRHGVWRIWDQAGKSMPDITFEHGEIVAKKRSRSRRQGPAQ